MPFSNALVAQLRELTTFAEQECKQLDTQTHEIDILLKQTDVEIGKLQQRQIEAANRLRQVEANIQAYPPAEIKSAYAAAQDVQMRLFMMRSQLEMLQAKQEALQSYHGQVDRLSLLIGQVFENEGAETFTADSEEILPSHQAIVDIIEAQEAERQRLSRQMHDGPAQSLTNLILQAEIVERIYDADPARARSELGNLKNAANSTFQRIRDFIFDLRPMMLDDLGLLPTLKRYTQTYETKAHISIPLTVQGERTLSPYLQMTIFRTAQELLNNAARHAQASKVQIALDLNNPVVLSVEDDGSGFDVASVLNAARQRGTSGLVNMEKRIGMLGGKTQIASGAGRGTRVRIEIPAP